MSKKNSPKQRLKKTRSRRNKGLKKRTTRSLEYIFIAMTWVAASCLISGYIYSPYAAFSIFPASCAMLILRRRDALNNEFLIQDNDHYTYEMLLYVVFTTLSPGILIAWAFRMRSQNSIEVESIAEIAALSFISIISIAMGLNIVKLRREIARSNLSNPLQATKFRERIQERSVKKPSLKKIR